MRAEVDERDLSKICVPQRATIRVDGMPGTELAAVSESMSLMMRSRSLYTDDHPATGGGDVREVMLSMSGEASFLQILGHQRFLRALPSEYEFQCVGHPNGALLEDQGSTCF